VSVKQGLNDPPVLVAANKQTSRVIFDPNPQLKKIELGQASVYMWKDKEGMEWKGGLYKPSDLQTGPALSAGDSDAWIQRIRIQTLWCIPNSVRGEGAGRNRNHGSTDSDRSGQANCPIVTPEEGLCAITMLESAANQLVSEGLADPERIGIIGFSRTCFS
jgi:hypothetical protein